MLIIFFIKCKKTFRKKIVDLKTGFLRIFFWTFIEVKRTKQQMVYNKNRYRVFISENSMYVGNLF
jgi:hypothetical protein